MPMTRKTNFKKPRCKRIHWLTSYFCFYIWLYRKGCHLPATCGAVNKWISCWKSLVPPVGIEPTSCGFSVRRSDLVSYKGIIGMRTWNIPFWCTDLYKQDGVSSDQFYPSVLLSQCERLLAPPVGLEPTTYWLTANRSADWAKGEYKRAVYLQDSAQVLTHRKEMKMRFSRNLVAVGGIWTHDLLVMSQASCQTALPRVNN